MVRWRFILAFWAAIVLLIALLVAVYGIGLWQWMLNNQDLAAGFLTAAVLLAGLIFAYLQLNDVKKDRHAQILLSLSHDWRTPEMQKARGEIGRKVLEKETAEKSNGKVAPSRSIILATVIDAAIKEDPPLSVELMKVADFFEDMGLLVGKKFAHPPELILEVFGASVIFYWDLYKETVSEFRKKFERVDAYEWFEYLYRTSVAFTAAKQTTSAPAEKRPPAKQLFRDLSDEFR